MVNRKILLAELQKLMVRQLEPDLRQRTSLPEIERSLRAEYNSAVEVSRTADSFEEWRSGVVTQTAAAWVLTCVFARFLEDNRLVDPPRISGPGDRLNRARDERELYFRNCPSHTDREYLLSVFDRLAQLPSCEGIFAGHNPIRQRSGWLSGDGAKTLLNFFQRIDPASGLLAHDFSDPDWDTRFLGDLYQDLSEEARKKYALLQTPDFVEEFILDRTLDPAIDEFGLDGFRMIDPACGSGHFLLGSFRRLFERWIKAEPGTNPRALAQRALDSVHGVDINPYAVAIARVRLLLAALRACGIDRLADAPAFRFNVVCGDSLLHGVPLKEQLVMGFHELAHAYGSEDLPELNRILRPGRYHAVVANPPYITPKDKALNQAYRDRYSACHRKYSLSVPFMQRIFGLTVEGAYTGQITANSFMKREFGKKIIEEFFATIELTHVIDTSGAYVPGHGTPTVILFGRNRKPLTANVRAVMGIRGEPTTPLDPGKGAVWSAILSQVDRVGSQSAFVSVSEIDRSSFHHHPWSIGGGGAAELKEQLEAGTQLSLSHVTEVIGVFGMTNADEVMLAPAQAFRRRQVELKAFKRLVVGDEVRDWSYLPGQSVIFPYENERLLEIDSLSGLFRWLWPCRTTMGNRATFAKKTYFAEGRPWWEWHQVTLERLHTPLSIVLAFVATHNHFVLDRGGKVFNRSAPVIKLPKDATEDDHLGLLGLLDSSTACFWIKQVSHNKGSTVDQHGARQTTVAFENFWEHDGTKLKQFPVTSERPFSLAQVLHLKASLLHELTPKTCLKNWASSANLGNLKQDLAVTRLESAKLLSEMIAFQEELDWTCYDLYDLMPERGQSAKADPPPVQLGERAFEILMARRMAAGELETTWFQRHRSTPITEIPRHWPEEHRQLTNRRIGEIESNPDIRLIEQPQYKRRWNTEPWESQLERALRSWLLDRLESYCDYDGRMNDERKPTARLGNALVSVASVSNVAGEDARFMEVAEVYRGRADFDRGRLVEHLVEAESVPLLPILRYKPNGLEKREVWERTWELQRLEDAIDDRAKLPRNDSRYLKAEQAQEEKRLKIGSIPVPPKYGNVDFLTTSFWRLRGKLDVPKERWVSFPYCEGEDGTPVIAWAGLDHLQLAKAIGAYYADIEQKVGGTGDPRLVPLLACILELVPWLKQWHNEVDPEFNTRMGDYFESFVEQEARNMGLTVADVRSWQPPKKAGKRAKR